jgi:hypothetical protein
MLFSLEWVSLFVVVIVNRSNPCIEVGHLLVYVRFQCDLIVRVFLVVRPDSILGLDGVQHQKLIWVERFKASWSLRMIARSLSIRVRF